MTYSGDYVSPSVTVKEIDLSEVPIRGHNKVFTIDDGPYAPPVLIKSVYRLRYEQDSECRSPELYYLAHNSAFNSNKNKLPRGKCRKL